MSGSVSYSYILYLFEEGKLYLRFVQKENKRVVEGSHLKQPLLRVHLSSLQGDQGPKQLTVRC